ncbi:hypothetical protein Scep_027845 [Stephania cephalantha]|uniref:Uncharacterized protein n=1 Tax=Stephania cephalantha TaxID=152367 RepID=A0AAP0EG67_9MAGN
MALILFYFFVFSKQKEANGKKKKPVKIYGKTLTQMLSPCQRPEGAYIEGAQKTQAFSKEFQRANVFSAFPTVFPACQSHQHEAPSHINPTPCVQHPLRPQKCTKGANTGRWIGIRNSIIGGLQHLCHRFPMPSTFEQKTLKLVG